MSLDVCSPMPSLRNKSLCARNKVAHVELFWGDARLVPQCAVTATYVNKTQYMKMIFYPSAENSKTKNYFITTTFRKLLFITQYWMWYAIYIPLNTVNLTNRPYDACLWNPAKRNKVCKSKQLRFVESAKKFNENQALKVISGLKYLYLSFAFEVLAYTHENSRSLFYCCCHQPR